MPPALTKASIVALCTHTHPDSAKRTDMIDEGATSVRVRRRTIAARG
eukprot:COSAG04_NODE_300_length_17427_cov_16.169725_1_plen_47_part_00